MYRHPGFTPSPEYVAAQEAAYQRLLDLGVTLGSPVTLTARQRQVGHSMCSFHLVETATGEDVDGGEPTTLLSLLDDGTYGGKPGDYTLVPCN